MFTKDEVLKVYEMAKEEDRFLPASHQDSNGTLFAIDRMETKGVKLIISPRGQKEELNRYDIELYISSPLLWIGENDCGRWVGLQGGWPSSPEEQKEEVVYSNAVMSHGRGDYPKSDLSRKIEFMRLERSKRSYVIQRSGWLRPAQCRIKLYEMLKSKKIFSEAWAAKIAQKVELDFGTNQPKFFDLFLNYTRDVFLSFLKVAFITMGIFKIVELFLLAV